MFSIARDHEQLWLAPMVARIAVIYDMDNIFAWQAQPQSTAFDFSNESHRLYQPFWRNGLPIDVFSSERLNQNMSPLSYFSSNYDVILLPAPMMISDKLYEQLDSFVNDKGGSLWVGFRADIKVSTNSQMRTEPSRLALLAGVTVNEFESINNGMPSVPLKNILSSTSNSDSDSSDINITTASGSVWRDGLRILNETSNEVVPI